ncbi:hypothetical protein D3C85_1805070 [compost metagenome]
MFNDLPGFQISSNGKVKHESKYFDTVNPDFFRGCRGDVLYIDSKLGLKFYVENITTIEHFKRVELIEESDCRN